MKKKRVAIIPARGGSKRVPRKNIKDFLGKPVILYSIEAAVACNAFDEIMVSTEDEDIAAVAVSAGANVPFLRSKENANDHATISEVLLEVLDRYEKKGISFEEVCCIYPTAPLIQPYMISDALEKLRSAEAVLSVFEFPSPIQRALVQSEKGFLSMREPGNKNTRTQDCISAFFDAGAFFCIKTEVLLEKKTVFVPKLMPYVIPSVMAIDIDTQEDWEFAEVKYRVLDQLGKLKK